MLGISRIRKNTSPSAPYSPVPRPADIHPGLPESEDGTAASSSRVLCPMSLHWHIQLGEHVLCFGVLLYERPRITSAVFWTLSSSLCACERFSMIIASSDDSSVAEYCGAGSGAGGAKASPGRASLSRADGERYRLCSIGQGNGVPPPPPEAITTQPRSGEATTTQSTNCTACSQLKTLSCPPHRACKRNTPNNSSCLLAGGFGIYDRRPGGQPLNGETVCPLGVGGHAVVTVVFPPGGHTVDPPPQAHPS